LEIGNPTEERPGGNSDNSSRSTVISRVDTMARGGEKSKVTNGFGNLAYQKETYDTRL